jgi:predicted nucleic acid-binding protein
MILLDTSVLSRALRRKRASHADPIAAQLERLLEENIPVGIPGIVMQEILSGIRSSEQFSSLYKRLEPFPIVLATTADHVQAAQIVNRCRSRGLATTSIDALIAALTIQRDANLFTTDHDFFRIAGIEPLKLLPPNRVAS